MAVSIRLDHVYSETHIGVNSNQGPSESEGPRRHEKRIVHVVRARDTEKEVKSLLATKLPDFYSPPFASLFFHLLVHLLPCQPQTTVTEKNNKRSAEKLQSSSLPISIFTLCVPSHQHTSYTTVRSARPIFVACAIVTQSSATCSN